jgi:hypothetical protein
MKNRARYRQAMDAAPVTAWTKIARAVHPQSPENVKSLHELVGIYDTPLLRLFEWAADNAASAEDWKQDFVVSKLLTGQVFQAAKPVGQFRKYLAAAVRNYVINRRKADAADKRRPTSGSLPFSQIGVELSEPFESHLAAPGEDHDYERVLTRYRAWDIFHEAHCALERWCAEQPDAAELMPFVAQIRSPETEKLSMRSTLAGRVARRFKQLLKQGVREELLIDPDQDENMILDREITIFFRALDEP